MSALERLYFDHNASTPADPRVLDRFVSLERELHANPGSLHQSGRTARAVLEDARETIARCFDCDPAHVVFVSGGTEANNLAVQTLGDTALPVLCSPGEHPSAFAAGEARGRIEFAMDRVAVAQVVAPAEAVGLICLVHGQNEIGTVQPVGAAANLANALGIPLHVDIAQTLGRIPVSGVVTSADSAAISPHKLGGLPGGVLLGRGIERMRPLMHGGSQEYGLRPGTVSATLAATNAYAIQLAFDETEQRGKAMRAARSAFERELTNLSVDVLTPSGAEESLPNTTMIRFEGVEGRSLLPALDIAGVEASAGSACSAGSPKPPRVLRAIGLSENDARRCVRFSFSYTTTVEDAVEGARRVTSVVERLRSA